MSKIKRPDTPSPHLPAATNRVGIVTPLLLRRLHGQLVESIGMSIAGGEVESGQQISPESLVEKFGVSRTVVREALKVLETKGMVGARPRTGTRARPQNEWKLLDPDVIRWRSTGPDSARQLEELLGIRGAIEPLAARNASDVASPGTVQPMVDALAAMSDTVSKQDWAAFTEADVSFHHALLSASGSLVIDQLADPIEAALRVRHKLRLVPTAFPETVVQSHQAILDAILCHDAPQAELMSRRIVDVAGAEIMAELMGRGSQDQDAASCGGSAGVSGSRSQVPPYLCDHLPAQQRRHREAAPDPRPHHRRHGDALCPPPEG